MDKACEQAYDIPVFGSYENVQWMLETDYVIRIKAATVIIL